ncbi:MAG: calcium-transporting P-type ATPase, PMR1-type [Candidatus Altiarchaeota archaeon]|nr:calcium-transporting P-type ATPase, PMR1-type [Candidatus Altiarchaeota archaeon]
MEYYCLGCSEVLKKLGSSEDGLSKEEATKRLEKFGSNELRQEKKESPLTLFLNQFRNFLILILVIATVVSFAIGEVLDAVVILIIVILNAILGFVQEYRAEKSLEALQKLTTPYATVVRGGREIKIPSKELVPGDIIALEMGDKIPADARIMRSLNLKVDEAALTGESVAVDKSTEPLKEGASLGDRRNMLHAGTIITYGKGRAVVVETGMKTELGKIAGLVQATKREDTPLQKRLAVLGKQLGILILVICGVIFTVGVIEDGFSPENVTLMFLTAVALAVAAIPEGLPAVVTMALAIGTQKMAKRNAIVRKLPAVETLGSCDVICTDKTGTLTKNEMTVTRIFVDDLDVEVSGSGYDKKGTFSVRERPRNSAPPGLATILKAGVLCNNATLGDGENVGDPTELAILIAGEKGGMKKEETEEKFHRAYEIQFDSERKRMSTVNKANGRNVVYTKGGVEIVLSLCNSIYKNGRIIKLDKRERERILAKNNEMAEGALRVLGFAFRELKPDEDLDKAEKDLVFLGMMGMIDPPRPECKESIKTAKQEGIDVKMITGDYEVTAKAIARELGIIDGKYDVVTGKQLDEMSDDVLAKRVDKIAVFARVNPEHKLRIVKALQKNGHIVAMTGDGVNDAPALKKADIGVAMGITGTEVTKEAGSMVLADDNFSTIVNAVEQGRIIFNNIRKFVLFLLSSNIAEVLIIFTAILIFSSGEAILPLLPVQILWVNLVTDGLPALALGIDPPEKGIMKGKPRAKGEGVFSKTMLRTIIVVGIVITLGTLWVFNSELENGLIKAQTMAFTTLMMFEMVNVFNARSVKQSLFKVGFLKNRYLLLTVGVSIILQVAVVYMPFLNSAFETTPLEIMDWVKILVLSMSVFVAVEIWKVIERRLEPL